VAWRSIPVVGTRGQPARSHEVARFLVPGVASAGFLIRHLPLGISHRGSYGDVAQLSLGVVMLDEAAIAIATGTAGNIVAYLFYGRVDALRTHVVRIFRHGTEQERSAVLRRLEDDTVALTQQGASKTDLTERWTSLLLSYLTAHPEARGDIEAFASAPVINKTMNIGSQHNHGSGPFIGGDNYGSLTFKGPR
jgi:hypothetical protein